MNIWTKLLASTMPSIEKVNRLRQAKKREKPGSSLHVAPGIDMDRAADAGDDQHHHQAQRIEAEAEIDLAVADRQPVRRSASRSRVPAGQQMKRTLRTKPRTTAAMDNRGAEPADSAA